MGNEVFLKAISNMASDMAYKKAVLHLYRQGKSIGDIEKECLYPVTKEMIQKVIDEYEHEKDKPEGMYSYIEEIDSFGRKSFRKIQKDY